MTKATITLPNELLEFVNREREKTCQSKSSYISMLIKRSQAGVTLRKQPASTRRRK